MKKKPSLAPLGESEVELLHLVWEHGPATVADIHQHILATRQVAYTTVMNSLRKLADKGFLQFSKNGAAYVYEAARPPQEVKFNLLSGILDKVFKGSPVELVESLVNHEKISEKDMEEIQGLLAKMAADQQQNGGAK